VPATYGLIDGNSFYCSCERAFSPRLRGRAVVVLSNNDGCAIARTAEAKAAGLKMGDPWHKVRHRPEVRAAEVEWFSSNYALYGDMSRRMYQVLAARVPRVEPYSIDEMFLDLDMPGDVLALAQSLRDDVRRIAKIPTCIGLGPTKTIAKLANRLAKNDTALGGICDLRDARERAMRYAEVPVSEVWGIGRRMADRLRRLGIVSIADFIAFPAQDARDLLTVVGARVQAELRGTSCLPLAMLAPTKKGLAVTRSSACTRAPTTVSRSRASCGRRWHTTPPAPPRSCGRSGWSRGACRCSFIPTRTTTTPGIPPSMAAGSNRPMTPAP
jgi:DNA polymerase V